MRKKWIVSLVVVTIMLIGTLIPSFANENYDQYVFEDNESEMILDILEKSPLQERAWKNVKNASLYKMHYVNSEKLRDTVLVDGDVTDIISEEYQWIADIGDFEVEIVSDEGEWNILGYTEYLPVSISDRRIDMEKALSIAKNRADSENGFVVFPVCFWCLRYNARIIYFETGEGKYMIPYPSRADFAKLKAGKVYTAKEVVEKLDAYSPLDETFDEEMNPLEQSMGGNPNRFAEEPEITEHMEIQRMEPVMKKKTGRVFGIVFGGALVGTVLVLGFIMCAKKKE